MGGYRGICSEAGIFVSSKDAYNYALNRINQAPDLQDEFVEWFYSGNFMRIDEVENA